MCESTTLCLMNMYSIRRHLNILKKRDVGFQRGIWFFTSLKMDCDFSKSKWEAQFLIVTSSLLLFRVKCEIQVCLLVTEL